jgi:hypothetical protein
LIPYPKHVDPANPGPYWQRRTTSELAAETKRIADKNRRNAAARDRRQSSKHTTMDNRVGWAMAQQVERVNAKVETFVAETTDPLAADPDLTDGPRNLGESIMELNGQDYKAARLVARQRMTQPTPEQARRGLEAALKPDWAQRHADRRWSFGR